MSRRRSTGRLLAMCLVGIVAVPVAGHLQEHSQGPPVTGLDLVRLETDAAVEPLGIDDRAPRLSWALASTGRGIMQATCRVLVASRRDLLREGSADLWDSGVSTSPDPWVIYGGKPLASRTRYFWTVRVSANHGESSAWAPPTWFETALLDLTEWRGQWIAGPERRGPLTQADGEGDDAVIRAAGEFCRPVGWLTKGWSAQARKNNQGECRELRPAPMLRRAFTVREPVARARLYVSGLAYADLTINGRSTSDTRLEPGFTDYSKSVLYRTDDVTVLLQPGENVITATLGSGHFDDAAQTWDWGWEQAQWRGTPRMRAELHVTYSGGADDVIPTDASWKSSVDGPTRFDSYYLGETYDARREIAHWTEPGFSDAAWASARVVDGPSGVMRAETHEPVRVVGTRAPGTRSEPVAGVIVYDIGQNLTGWVEVSLEAPAGTALEVFYSEKLAGDGTATTDGNALVYGQLQTDYYVARGLGRETWSPRFSYKGFQYVQLSAPNRQPLPHDVRASVTSVAQVRSGLASTSQFETDQPTLGRIHRNTWWAVQNNLHGVITDTPVYEKNAWTGDAQLTSGTASLLFDTERLYRKMFQDMADAQTDEGEVPLLSPSNRNYGYVGKPAFKPVDCCGATPAWDALWFVIPWESYARYGDRRALQRTWPLMRRYLDEWIPRWTSRDEDRYAYTLTSGLGDWLPPEGVPTLNALVSSAFYARMARIAAGTARALGETEVSGQYESLFEKIRGDFNARFMDADGIYREKEDDGFVQTAQVLPLAFDLVPEDRRTAVAARLADDIVNRRGGHAYVGVIGAAYVLPLLTATGHHDVAFTVATKTDEPSWGYWTDTLGFTSLGESWPADTRSRNHHFFGAIAQWFYEDLAGIRPVEPGYAVIEYRPEIPTSGLDRVSASYESVRGTIASEWRRTATGLAFDVTVPPNARGRIYVPVRPGHVVREVGSGTDLPAERAPAVAIAGREQDRIVYEVGSGRYEFRVGPGQ